MRYIVRKEGLSWIVRGSNGHYYAARRTHADAMTWADTLATTPAKRRTDTAINRIHASLERIKERTMSNTCRLCGSRDGWHKWSCTNLPPCGNPTPDPCEKCSCKRAKENR